METESDVIVLSHMVASLSKVRPSRNEETLQRRIGGALNAAGLKFKREAKVSNGIVDFLVEGRIAVEVKTAGGMNTAIAQLKGYLKTETVTAGLIVTTRPWKRSNFPPQIEGKRTHLVRIWESAL